MASSLNEKKTIEQMIDEDLAKYRAIADRDQERIRELEEGNAYLADTVRSSLVVPAAAFAAGYVRGYYGEKASIFGSISIDAGVGLLLNGFAALLGFSSNKAAQTVAKLCGDIAKGALGCWAAGMGAELGLKKRMERPALPPAPKPITGAENMPQRAPQPLTHEELAAFPAFTASPAFNSQPAMQERPPVPMQWAAPTQSPAPPPPKTNPLPMAEAVAPKTNPLPMAVAVAPKAPAPQSPAPQQSQSNTQQSPTAKAEAAPEASSTRKTHFRFTQRRPVDDEAG